MKYFVTFQHKKALSYHTQLVLDRLVIENGVMLHYGEMAQIIELYNESTTYVLAMPPNNSDVSTICR